MNTQISSNSLRMRPLFSNRARLGKALALTSGLLVVGLSGCDTTNQSQSDDRSVVAITAASGEQKTETRTVDSTIGKTLMVTLPGNSGTGYTWSMTSHSEGIQLEGAPVTKPLKADTPGGPTVTTFELMMEESGRQTARLELARAWEADTPPARVIDLVITVQDNP
ncbi:MAG: protease inhibitor I42 family protein [Phycisphaerales bacterium]|nr:protease inhibitor I42 family protein [Phycisphaerales bacterium]